MARHFAANTLTLLIVGLLVLISVIVWGKLEFEKPGPLSETAYVEVPRGASLRTVSDRLEEAGAISNGMIFRLGARYTGREEDRKFGSFEIGPGASMAEVLDIVTSGAAARARHTLVYVIRSRGTELRLSERKADEGTERIATFTPDALAPEYTSLLERGLPISYSITVAEGLTSWEIVEGLKAAPFLTGEVPDLPPEGSLAPSTYAVRDGEPRTEVLDTMRLAQEGILALAWQNRAADIPVTTPQEALILASIIEKETGVPEERGQVASVFVNRLRRGMKLQTDPTVVYGITEGKGPLGRGLLRSELARETAWNTYVIFGLPPTPIANPGRDAIEAALNPPESPFFYFVADGTGGHAFAETLEEHRVNVAKWRRIEAQQQSN